MGSVSYLPSGERLKGCRRAREIAGVFGTEFREVRETALGAVTLLLTALIVRMKQSGHILVVDRERRALVVDNCGGAYFALMVRCP